MSAFPFVISEDTRRFARQIDTGLATQREHGPVAMNHIDAHLLAQMIEIHVAGVHQRLMQVHPSMPAAEVTMKITLVESGKSGAIDTPGGIEAGLLQRGGSHHQLEG